jgi:acetyltransferase-like isoleucine patch superfamily enzyme
MSVQNQELRATNSIRVNPQSIKTAHQRGTLFHSVFGGVMCGLYRMRVFRPFVRGALNVFERGNMFSMTWRDILLKQYQVRVGMYSYGECLKPGVLPPGTEIGNYCSLASHVIVFRRNHPVDRISQHPLFYNMKCGMLNYDTVEIDLQNPLIIEHDVWVGAGTIILPKCRRIGTGAVIGAGSVVTRDVENFSIVAGNPARHIRYRFPAELQEALLQSQWWNMPIGQLMENLPDMIKPADSEAVERVASPFDKNR